MTTMPPDPPGPGQDPFSTPPMSQAPSEPQGGYPPPGYAGYGQYGTPAQARNGMGVAGLVLGILGLVLFWIPVVGLILAILGTIFGFVGMGRANKGFATNKGMAIAGLVMGILGVLVGLWYLIAIGSVFDDAVNCSEQSQTQEELQRCLEDL